MNPEQTTLLQNLLTRAFARKAEILRQREETFRNSLREIAELRKEMCCYSREAIAPEKILDSEPEIMFKVTRPLRTGQESLKKVCKRPSRKAAPCKKPSRNPNRLKVVAETIAPDPEKRLIRPDLRTKDPTFSSRVVRLVRDRFNNDAPAVYRAAGVSRQVYSKIISSADYPVSRHTAIQLAFGLKLPPKEAGSLLHAAGFHFSPCRDEDIIFTTCLEAGVYDLTEVNQVLQEHNLSPLNLQH